MPDEDVPVDADAEADTEPGVGDANLPPVAEGFLRIIVRLPRGEMTPGELARWAGVELDHLGPIAVLDGGGEGAVDVAYAFAKTARGQLGRLGPTRLVDWQWRWMRLGIGRNHPGTAAHQPGPGQSSLGPSPFPAPALPGA